MSDLFAPPEAPLKPTADPRPWRQRVGTITATLVCALFGSVFLVDLLRDVWAEGTAALTNPRWPGPSLLRSRYTLLEQTANLSCGSLLVAAGRSFWVRRRLRALVLILLTIVALSLTARLVAQL